MTLQRICLPEPSLPSEPTLFLRTKGAVQTKEDALHLAAGARAGFDTWMNLVNLTNWQAHCVLSGLWLQLAGQGRVLAELRELGQTSALWSQTLELTATGTTFDIGDLLPDAQMLCLHIEAETESILAQPVFLTGDTGLRDLRLAIGITTFRREAEVAQTAARLGAYFDSDAGAEVAAHTDVFVIDNGQSVDLPAHPKITCIPNRNLGGSGGFARALSEAQTQDYSHCLFMDDDAACPVEALGRTVSFLRLARSDRAALTGAMIANANPWAVWENGAVFDRMCRSQYGGTDLRDLRQIRDMERAAAGAKPQGFYGGWWFFAFPIGAVDHYPYPFFVRGDDSAFSLVNQFDHATLNGVVSFQDGFDTKETPLVHYLDLRYHLHHHMALPGHDIGVMGTIKLAVRMILRTLLRMHYASAEAQLVAWEDVLKGPAFFVANADMAAKRAQIGALSKPEGWGEAAEAKTDTVKEPALLFGRLMQMLLNGHLIPFWGWVAPKRRLAVGLRGRLWPIWGTSGATYVDDSATPARSYTVQHSKRRFWGLMWRMTRLAWRWWRAYPALQRAYRESMPQMASADWWAAQFDQDADKTDP